MTSNESLWTEPEKIGQKIFKLSAASAVLYISAKLGSRSRTWLMSVLTCILSGSYWLCNLSVIYVLTRIQAFQFSTNLFFPFFSLHYFLAVASFLLILSLSLLLPYDSLSLFAGIILLLYLKWTRILHLLYIMSYMKLHVVNPRKMNPKSLFLWMGHKVQSVIF